MNLSILLGRVGADPEIKEFDFGKIATFTLATTERGFKTKDGKEIPDVTDWHKIVVKGGLAKVVEGYVNKGSQIQVTGKIRTRSWEKDGVKHYVTEIICSDLELIGGKPKEQTETHEQSYAPTPTGNHTDAPGANPNNEPEDDLPF